MRVCGGNCIYYSVKITIPTILIDNILLRKKRLLFVILCSISILPFFIDDSLCIAYKKSKHTRLLYITSTPLSPSLFLFLFLFCPRNGGVELRDTNEGIRRRTRTVLTEKRASLGEWLPGSVIKSSPLAPSKMIHRRTMLRQDCPESKTYAHAREHTRASWSTVIPKRKR